MCTPRVALDITMQRAVCLASERAGLTPTGHKFIIYSPRARAQLTAEERDAVDALEADLESHTPAQDLAVGRRCVAHSEGVDVARVPIGEAAYVRGFARARLAEHRRAHERIRLLTCVHSACVIHPAGEPGTAVRLSGARLWAAARRGG